VIFNAFGEIFHRAFPLAERFAIDLEVWRLAHPRQQLGRGIALTSLAVSISSAAGPTLAAAILAIAVAVSVRGQCTDRRRRPGSARLSPLPVGTPPP
jgi:hypothetical protein